jgi:hypothetical protein
MTQAVINIDRTSEDLNESLLSVAPKVEPRLIEGQSSLSTLDPDMRKFFRKSSVQGSMLVRQPFTGRKHVISVPADEARVRDYEKIQREIAPGRDLPIELAEPSEAKLAKRHPFIIRARYRLRENP